MKRLAIIFALLAASFAAKAYTPEDYTKAEYMIPMRDSVRIYTAVYTPSCDTSESPIIWVRTPYSCYPYGEEFTKDLKSNMAPYVERGYIIVYQDVRGRNRSEGDFENVRRLTPEPSQSLDARDVYDSAEWLLKHVKSNGAIGFKGISYPGYYAFVAGLSGHPAIKAVSPQAPVTDWFIGDDFRHNGALMILDASRFGRSFLRVRKHYDQKFPQVPELFEGSSYDYFLQKRTVEAVNKDMGADTLTFWKQMCAHPDYDDFWADRNTVNAIKKPYAPAVLVMGGTYDAEDLYGIFATYQGVRTKSPSTPLHLVIGPFTHGGWRSSKADHIGSVHMTSFAHKDMIPKWEAQFFDYYLKGVGERPQPVEYVADGGGVDHPWQSADVWPPKGAQKQSLKLTADTPKVSYVSDPANPVPFVENPEKRQADYMVADQGFARSRQDVLTFDTQRLTSDVLAAGPISVKLNVALSKRDADFVVKVIDIAPDGTSQLVRGNVFRGRYRKGFDDVNFFRSGRSEDVEFTLEDICHVFPAGHSISIQIQSSWFPLVDMNPQTKVWNIVFAKKGQFKKEKVTLNLAECELTLSVLDGQIPTSATLVK